MSRETISRAVALAKEGNAEEGAAVLRPLLAGEEDRGLKLAALAFCLEAGGDLPAARYLYSEAVRAAPESKDWPGRLRSCRERHEAEIAEVRARRPWRWPLGAWALLAVLGTGVAVLSKWPGEVNEFLITDFAESDLSFGLLGGGGAAVLTGLALLAGRSRRIIRHSREARAAAGPDFADARHVACWSCGLRRPKGRSACPFCEAQAKKPKQRGEAVVAKECAPSEPDAERMDEKEEASAERAQTSSLVVEKCSEPSEREEVVAERTLPAPPRNPEPEAGGEDDLAFDLGDLSDLDTPEKVKPGAAAKAMFGGVLKKAKAFAESEQVAKMKEKATSIVQHAKTKAQAAMQSDSVQNAKQKMTEKAQQAAEKVQEKVVQEREKFGEADQSGKRAMLKKWALVGGAFLFLSFMAWKIVSQSTDVNSEMVNDLHEKYDQYSWKPEGTKSEIKQLLEDYDALEETWRPLARNMIPLLLKNPIFEIVGSHIKSRTQEFMLLEGHVLSPDILIEEGMKLRKMPEYERYLSIGEEVRVSAAYPVDLIVMPPYEKTYMHNAGVFNGKHFFLGKRDGIRVFGPPPPSLDKGLTDCINLENARTNVSVALEKSRSIYIEGILNKDHDFVPVPNVGEGVNLISNFLEELKNMRRFKGFTLGSPKSEVLKFNCPQAFVSEREGSQNYKDYPLLLFREDGVIVQVNSEKVIQITYLLDAGTVSSYFPYVKKLAMSGSASSEIPRNAPLNTDYKGDREKAYADLLGDNAQSTHYPIMRCPELGSSMFYQIDKDLKDISAEAFYLSNGKAIKIIAVQFLLREKQTGEVGELFTYANKKSDPYNIIPESLMDFENSECLRAFWAGGSIRIPVY